MPRLLRFFWIAFVFAHGASVQALESRLNFQAARNRGSVFGEALTRALELKGVSLTLHSETGSGSWVRIFCERIGVGSEEVRGVRIGVIPRLEVRGMEWSIRGDAGDFGWCREVVRFFDQEPHLRAARFDGFSLVCAEGGAARVVAGEARFDDRGRRLVLTDVQAFRAGQARSFPSAVLDLSGEHAGQLKIRDQSGGDLLIPLLPPSNPPADNRISEPQTDIPTP